jgi:hypothetical protein
MLNIPQYFTYLSFIMEILHYGMADEGPYLLMLMPGLVTGLVSVGNQIHCAQKCIN